VLFWAGIRYLGTASALDLGFSVFLDYTNLVLASLSFFSMFSFLFLITGF